MTQNRAPKQWSLTKRETITSFEAWRQNIQYTISLDPNFADFLNDQARWQKKSPTSPTRGFTDDGEDVPTARRRTAQQKCTHLDLMLGQIANFCPIISRHTIVKNSTSLTSIWQAIRQHYGFQLTGAHFLDLANIKLEQDERSEDLFQRLMSFVEDNLLAANGTITHHGEALTRDEEMTPSLENMIVLTWLRLIHPDLPALIKQRYGTELRSRTLATLKPEISQALDSLLDEARTTADTKILRASAQNKAYFPRRDPPTQAARLPPTRKRPASCPLCKQTGRNDQHFLSRCPFLPPDDRSYLSKARHTSDPLDIDDDPEDYDPGEPLEYRDPQPPPTSTARISSRCVSAKQSPSLTAYYKQHPLKLTLDTGAETSMMKASVARSLGVTPRKTSQRALQADGVTPLTVVGEIRILLSRGGNLLNLDALVVEDLDVDVLAGTPFLIANDISLRPAKSQIIIRGSDVVDYFSGLTTGPLSSVRRTQSHVLRSPSTASVIWPGEFLELTVPPELGQDCILAVEPHTVIPPSEE